MTTVPLLPITAVAAESLTLPSTCPDQRRVGACSPGESVDLGRRAGGAGEGMGGAELGARVSRLLPGPPPRRTCSRRRSRPGPVLMPRLCRRVDDGGVAGPQVSGTPRCLNWTARCSPPAPRFPQWQLVNYLHHRMLQDGGPAANVPSMHMAPKSVPGSGIGNLPSGSLRMVALIRIVLLPVRGKSRSSG